MLLKIKGLGQYYSVSAPTPTISFESIKLWGSSEAFAFLQRYQDPKISQVNYSFFQGAWKQINKWQIKKGGSQKPQ